MNMRNSIYHEKVFDSVYASAVVKSLEDNDIGKFYINIIKKICKKATITIRLH